MLERGTARKVAVIALVVMTIALAAVGAVILYQVQTQQTPKDSLASGFGSSANRSNFTNVELAFLDTPCEFFLNKDYVTNTGSTILDSLGLKFSHGRDRGLEYENDFAKSCFYYFKDAPGGTKIIELRVKAYKTNSTIDPNAEALYSRINTPSITITESGRIEPAVNYFFGQAKGLTEICRTNLFHDQNDFEYAAISYSGFKSCAEIIEVNQLLTAVIAGRVSDVMLPFLIPVGDIQAES
jgi:hypothetical protein